MDHQVKTDDLESDKVADTKLTTTSVSQPVPKQ